MLKDGQRMLPFVSWTIREENTSMTKATAISPQGTHITGQPIDSTLCWCPILTYWRLDQDKASKKNDQECWVHKDLVGGCWWMQWGGGGSNLGNYSHLRPWRWSQMSVTDGMYPSRGCMDRLQVAAGQCVANIRTIILVGAGHPWRDIDIFFW